MSISSRQHQLRDEVSTVRLSLREATHHHHVLLNRHPLLQDLTRPDLDLSTYRTLLTAYFQLYQKLEERIDGFLTLHPDTFDYTARRKLPWLCADIEFFKIVIDAQGGVSSRMHGVPEIHQIGHLAGVLYAIEGSTLGGQFISRCLSEHHGLTVTTGARFFNGYGESTQIMWQEFLGFSERIAGDTIQCQAAEQAACQTFQLFNQVLDAFVHQEPEHQGVGR